MAAAFDINDIKRRMQGSVAALRHDLASLRTGRASANLLDPIEVEAYGASMPLNQVATVSVPEPGSCRSRSGTGRWWPRREGDPEIRPRHDAEHRRTGHPSARAGDEPAAAAGDGEGGHKYAAEQARVAPAMCAATAWISSRSSRRTATCPRTTWPASPSRLQKATDQTISEIDQALAAVKEKEIMQV